MKGDNSHNWQSSGWLRRGCRCPAEVTKADKKIEKQKQK